MSSPAPLPMAQRIAGAAIEAPRLGMCASIDVSWVPPAAMRSPVSHLSGRVFLGRVASRAQCLQVIGRIRATICEPKDVINAATILAADAGRLACPEGENVSSSNATINPKGGGFHVGVIGCVMCGSGEEMTPSPAALICSTLDQMGESVSPIAAARLLSGLHDCLQTGSPASRLWRDAGHEIAAPQQPSGESVSRPVVYNVTHAA